jgi:LacI family transcriptional regulator
MRDVAELAGVSQSTVSFIVNQRDAEIGISEETRARVLAAIESSGYRLNLAARGLRLQRFRTFGVVTDSIASSPFAGRTLLGAQDVAWENDHLLLMVNTGANRAIETSAVQSLIDRGVDGLLYAAERWREIELPRGFDSAPSVLVNCWYSGDRRVSAVVPCEVEGGRQAAAELILHGHRHLAFLGGTGTDPSTVEREQGFRQAMADARLPVQSRWVCPDGDYGIRSGYELAARLYRDGSSGPLPTGLVCGNDRMAVGAIVALLEQGLRVPADVSVIGYDDQESLAEAFVPALTTVSIPHYEMGRAAVEHLLRSALSQSAADSQAATIPVPGRLIRRSSVAAPPAR